MVAPLHLLAFAGGGPYALYHFRMYCGLSFVRLGWNSCDRIMRDEVDATKLNQLLYLQVLVPSPCLLLG